MLQGAKNRSEMSAAEMIVDSGWWTEGEPGWQALPLTERERIALDRTGCKFAYPTWERPINCIHLKCQIARGELPKVAETNCVLRGEMRSGWLRFIDDRQKLARICRACRKAARETSIYDPWTIGWQGMVFLAVKS
jgi:hypothetical protein